MVAILYVVCEIILMLPSLSFIKICIVSLIELFAIPQHEL
jgi:hypothetical protein